MSQGSSSFSLFITRDNYALSTSLTGFVNTAKRFRLACLSESIHVLAPAKQGARMAKNSRTVFEANEVARLIRESDVVSVLQRDFQSVGNRPKRAAPYVYLARMFRKVFLLFGKHYFNC